MSGGETGNVVDSSTTSPSRADGLGGARRVHLSREEILRAAIAMADQDGVTSVTMRRLGHRLGVEAMSLYRYVNGREDLLEGITDRLVGQLRTDPSAVTSPSNGWQAYLQWFAHGVRNIATAHPLIFPLIATRHPAATWLRPPLRSVAVVEDFLTALTERGLTDLQAVGVYRSFTSFLLGQLLLESATLGAATGPVEEPLNEGDAEVATTDEMLDLDEYPTVLRLKSSLSEDHAEAEFEQGLEALLDRLDLLVSQ